MFGDVPFVERDDQRAAFLQHLVGDLEILHLEPARRVEQQHHHFGMVDRSLGVPHRQLFELVLDLGAFAQTGGVDQPHRPVVPVPVDGDRIARDAGLGPGDHPLLAEHLVDQGRFARVGAPDDRHLERTVFVVLVLGRVFLAVLALDERAQQLEQVDQPLAMLGRQRERLTEAELIGLHPPGLAGVALGLVGGDDHRRILAAQPARNLFVERGQPLSPVDHEQCDIGFAHRRLGLRAHPPGQAGGVVILEPGGIHHPEFEPEQLALALAPVAGHAGAIIDQRQALADKAIEQRRFADVRAADDGDGGMGHEGAVSA